MGGAKPLPHCTSIIASDPLPNENDIHSFAVACQIDPLFDEKYMPLVEGAARSSMPEGWKVKIDPDDRWYFIHTNSAGVPTESTWEHPKVEMVRDEVQALIAEDERREREMMEALNPIDPEQVRGGERTVKKNNECRGGGS